MCGKRFRPQTARVQTCGRTCGGVAVLLNGPPRLALPRPPGCPECGRASSGSRMCRACWVDHGSTTAILRKLGVLGNKHIPPEYLRAAESQRRALLAGLLDTDGYVARNGTVQFAVTNRRARRRHPGTRPQPGLPRQMTTKQVKGATEASFHVLHGHVHAGRQGIPADAEARCGRGPAAPHPHARAAGSSPTCGRSRPCRFAASRWTTQTTRTWPGVHGFRPTIQRWLWILLGRRR